MKTQETTLDSDCRMTYETFPDMVILTDHEMYTTWMNTAACKTLGLSLEKADGRLASEIICDPDDPSECLCAEALQTNKISRKVIEASSIEKTLDVIICPLRDNQGQIVRWLCIARDITESRHAEEALQKSEERYRELVDAIQEGLGLVDEHEFVQYCNPAFARIFEVPIDELIGRNLHDFVIEDSWRKIIGQTAARRTGEDSVYEITIQTGQRNLRYLEINASPRFGEEGEFVGTFGLVQDITERKRTLDELGQRIKELSCIYSISQAIETNDSLPDLAKKVSRLIVPSTEFPNETYAAIVLDDEIYETNTAKLQPQHKLEAPISIEGIVRGKIIISRKTVYSFSAEEQRLLRRIAESVQRAVQRRELQEQLFFAQKMESIGTLAGGIAHDFNNLMVGVLGSVTLLQERLGSDHPANSLLETIEESARRAGVLARHLLTYARGGKTQPELMNLNATIRNMIDLQKRFMPPQVSIESTLDPAIAGIEADLTQIQQIVINLCTNAAEAIDHEGQIHITTCNVQLDSAFTQSHSGLKPGAYVCVSVEDNGNGMNAIIKARMFEPFFTTKFDGRGLGLAVVYGIVKNHKGYIEAESQPGKGTTFRVYLPASQIPAPTEVKTETPASHSTGTVLIVDDEEVVLDITKMLLEKLGYHILTARNGREAVQIAETHEENIDITLLDLGMPVMDGHTAFPLLQQRRPEMKILICSGYAANGSARELLNKGAIGFIPKPFDLEALSSAVQAALHNENACHITEK